jgi:hypothetical protein
MISQPLRAPMNFAEGGGHGNERLDSKKIKVTPPQKWTDKFFEPLTMPDRTYALIKKQAFSPVTFSW